MSDTILAADLEIDLNGLSPETARAMLAARAATLHALATPAVAPGPKVLAWRLGSERFAFPLDAIAAVLSPLRTTPLPGAPAALVGIGHWRGEIVNIVDPGAVLGVAGEGQGGHLLLLRRAAPRIAVRVDRCQGVVALSGDAPTGDDLAAQAEDEAGGSLTMVHPNRMIAALGFGARAVGMGE